MTMLILSSDDDKANERNIELLEEFKRNKSQDTVKRLMTRTFAYRRINETDFSVSEYIGSYGMMKKGVYGSCK